jgi:hypothetical protein
LHAAQPSATAVTLPAAEGFLVEVGFATDLVFAMLFVFPFFKLVVV